MVPGENARYVSISSNLSPPSVDRIDFLIPSSTSSFFTYGILILPFLATLFKKSFTWITVKLEEALDIRNAVSFVGRRKQRLLWPGRVSTARHLLTANNFVEIEKGRESMDGRFYIGWWRHFKKKKREIGRRGRLMSIFISTGRRTRHSYANFIGPGR